MSNWAIEAMARCMLMKRPQMDSGQMKMKKMGLLFDNRLFFEKNSFFV